MPLRWSRSLYGDAGRALKQPLSACLLEYAILAHLKSLNPTRHPLPLSALLSAQIKSLIAVVVRFIFVALPGVALVVFV